MWACSSCEGVVLLVTDIPLRISSYVPEKRLKASSIAHVRPANTAVVKTGVFIPEGGQGHTLRVGGVKPSEWAGLNPKGRVVLDPQSGWGRTPRIGRVKS